MFGNSFGFGSMAILPSWHVVPFLGKRNFMFTDRKLNTVLVVDVADHDSMGNVLPERGTRGASFSLADGRSFEVPQMRDRFFLVSADGKHRSRRLGSHGTLQFERRAREILADPIKEFEMLDPKSEMTW
jgi:hypothetical protein